MFVSNGGGEAAARQRRELDHALLKPNISRLSQFRNYCVILTELSYMCVKLA